MAVYYISKILAFGGCLPFLALFLAVSGLVVEQGTGSGNSDVGPCPPMKCLEQINDALVTFSTVNLTRPQAFIHFLHLSKSKNLLGNFRKKTSFIRRLWLKRLSLLHVPQAQCFTTMFIVRVWNLLNVCR